MTPELLSLALAVAGAVATFIFRNRMNPSPVPVNPANPGPIIPGPVPVVPGPSPIFPNITPGTHPILDAILTLLNQLNSQKHVSGVTAQVLHPDGTQTEINVGASRVAAAPAGNG